MTNEKIMDLNSTNFGDLKNYLTKDLSTPDLNLIAIIEPSTDNSHEVLGLRTTVQGIDFDKKICDLSHEEELTTIMHLLRDAFNDSMFEVVAKLKNPEAEDGKVKIILTKENY